jgi:ferrous iron transport protein B
MGLTNRSTGIGLLDQNFNVMRSAPEDAVVALAGNPNVGKSTVFNNLTGLRQHTGNWPGKTVTSAQGTCRHKGHAYVLVDLPGTYSLMADSAEEEVARDFICFGNPDATVVIADATCLERNLNLVLQTLEITGKAVVCVNLIDEAKRKKIHIDLGVLSGQLGVPVIGASARSGKGLRELMDAVEGASRPDNSKTPFKVRYDEIVEQAISIVETPVREALGGRLDSRWVSLKILDGDGTLLQSIRQYLGFDLMKSVAVSKGLEEAGKLLEDAGIGQNQFRDRVVTGIVSAAETIAGKAVRFDDKKYNQTDRRIDKVLTSRRFGIPIMLLLLGGVFWLTITGANYPSEMLANLFFWVEDRLTDFLAWAGTPSWVHSLFVLGVYRTLAWVVSVMLPPMTIFFPLFTLLEDLGYLPRVAFNLDKFFKKACAHGKQALTMCMGFGCNAAGVISCRIIDSPRERLIATITNNFVPCNGRFPTLIAIITMFFVVSGPAQSVVSTALLLGVIVLGVVMTLLISKILSKTVLKGIPSSFALELPPYRKPQIGKVIVRSIFDRTLFVLGRAVLVAAPAGLIIWGMANIQVGDFSILTHCANFFDPFARMIGLDGFILMAFILGFPANEIVVPIIIMCYMATGSLLELDSLDELRNLFVSHGWTWLTAVCAMLFSLMHWPCGTTCWTIRKETQSWKWTLVSFLVPTAAGVVLCFLIANAARLLGLA